MEEHNSELPDTKSKIDQDCRKTCDKPECVIQREENRKLKEENISLKAKIRLFEAREDTDTGKRSDCCPAKIKKNPGAKVMGNACCKNDKESTLSDFSKPKEQDARLESELPTPKEQDNQPQSELPTPKEQDNQPQQKKREESDTEENSYWRFTDISDPLSPSRLSEKFNSIFLKEWEDAKYILMPILKELGSLQFLSDLLFMSNDFCKEKAAELLQSITKQKHAERLDVRMERKHCGMNIKNEKFLKMFLQRADETLSKQASLNASQKYLKWILVKLFDYKQQPDGTKGLAEQSVYVNEKAKRREVKVQKIQTAPHITHEDELKYLYNYIKVCVETCWFAAVAVPEVQLADSDTIGEEYDEKKTPFKEYIFEDSPCSINKSHCRKSKVVLIVWPYCYYISGGEEISLGTENALVVVKDE